MRIVFFGTPEFAGCSLRRLAAEGHDIAAVVTATDKPAGRGHKLLQSAVKQAAVELGLPVLQPERLRDTAFINELRALQADLFVVIAFRMLPEAVWAMPPLGTFNLHASLLPRYRGAAPINWALINGDTTTGITTFFIDADIDTGPVIDSVEVAINPDDNAGSLHDKLMTLGAGLTARTVADIEAGRVASRPQPELCPSPAPKIFASTCEIDWTKPAVAVHNLVRGLSPLPGARAVLPAPFGQMKILATGLGTAGEEPQGLEPGCVAVEGGRLWVGCGNGRPLEVKELQPAGKRRMAARDYLNGLRL